MAKDGQGIIDLADSQEFTPAEVIIELIIYRKVFAGINSRLINIATQVADRLNETSTLTTAHRKTRQSYSITIRNLASSLGISDSRLEELNEYVIERDTLI